MARRVATGASRCRAVSQPSVYSPRLAPPGPVQGPGRGRPICVRANTAPSRYGPRRPTSHPSQARRSSRPAAKPGDTPAGGGRDAGAALGAGMDAGMDDSVGDGAPDGAPGVVGDAAGDGMGAAWGTLAVTVCRVAVGVSSVNTNTFIDLSAAWLS